MTNPRSFKLLGILATAALLTVVPAVIQGRLTNRWGPDAGLEMAAARLERCPEQFGDWRCLDDERELSPGVIRELQIAGYIQRTYVHHALGAEFAVLLMVGAPGAISRHPPEICYEMRANEHIGEPAEVSVTDTEGPVHGFRVLRYRQPGAAGRDFLVCYGFTVDGLWCVPEYPRWKFGEQPLLYKIQVLVDAPVSEDGQLPTAVTEFLTEFLPVFRAACIK